MMTTSLAPIDGVTSATARIVERLLEGSVRPANLGLTSRNDRKGADMYDVQLEQTYSSRTRRSNSRMGKAISDATMSVPPHTDSAKPGLLEGFP